MLRYLLLGVATAWTVPLPAAPVAPLLPAVAPPPLLSSPLDVSAAAAAPVFFETAPSPPAALRLAEPAVTAARPVTGVTSAAASRSFAALCAVGALLGYGYGLKRQQAALALAGSRARQLVDSRSGPVMQSLYQRQRRDAVSRMRDREYNGGPYRGGYRSRGGYRNSWTRNAPEIFFEGLGNLARDPLGWLDPDRPSYLRSEGLNSRPYRQGRVLGDGVVSRTYGKRNLYESDANRSYLQNRSYSQNYRSNRSADYLSKSPDGIFEGRRRDHYDTWDTPRNYNTWDTPGNNYNSWGDRISQGATRFFDGNVRARRAMDQNRLRAYEAEQSIYDWKEGAQGPQSSIRQSEADHASRFARNADDRSFYRSQRQARSYSYDPPMAARREGPRTDGPTQRQNWARNAEARDAYRRMQENPYGGSYGGNYSGSIVPSGRSSQEYATYGDNNNGW